jgi:flagellar biosynthesis/type III secretory pathway M-ring protein FliF/YscJ
MNYHEKKTIVTSIVGLLVSISYIVFAIVKYNQASPESLTLKFWSMRMLIFIGIGIVAIIILLILFNIFYSIYLAIKLKIDNPELSDKEIEAQISQTVKTNTIEDEMAKLIELKSMRFSFAFVGFGFVLALVSLLLDFSPIIMLNILFLSFSLGQTLEGFVQLFYYKRGINHG